MNLHDTILTVKTFLYWYKNSFNIKHKFKTFGANSILEYPCRVESPQAVTVEENVNIRFGLSVINTDKEQVIIKRNTTIAPNVTIVTNNHVPTVGIPIFLLTSSHVNDKSSNIIIGSDVWIGTKVTILAGASLGRGCVVGANAVVTKPVPPYAVVVGTPAKIIATRFSKEQILHHEELMYKPENRLSEFELDKLFLSKFLHLPSIGLNESKLDNNVDIIRDLKIKKNI